MTGVDSRHMTITEEERERVEQELLERQRRELSDRMRALGKVRSKKKIAAARKNAALARAARHKPKRKR